MGENNEPDFEISSGNVFADLELPDADTLLRKSDLVANLYQSIRRLDLTIEAAALRIGIPQEQLEFVLGRGFDSVSEDVLKGYLSKLGCSTEYLSF